jgi:phospholipase/lecithinase/hemolysin
MNGRVWVEVLAQQLGLTNNYWYSTNSSFPVWYTNLSASSTNWSGSSNNWSYFGNYAATTNSGTLVPNVTSFPAPPDANTALFAIWVSSADLFFDQSMLATNIVWWTSAINLAQTNYLAAIQILYSKGARTILMPNAADITAAPYYTYLSAANKNFIRQRIGDYNNAFGAMVNQAEAVNPGLTIYVPDMHSVFSNVLANPSAYGLTNAGIDALHDTSLKNKSLNGPGANYIFWDQLYPSARMEAALSGAAAQAIAPAQIGKLTLLNGSNRLDLVNVPVGLDGLAYGSADLVNWTAAQIIDSTNVAQSIFVSPAGPPQYYRLIFPFAWTWP